MCTRFSFVASKERIEAQLGPTEVGSNLRNNFNISPTQHAYVIANENPSRLQYITWGLIPYWSKDGDNRGKLANARMEGIEAKPSFRLPIRQRRCLVVADSFYEWKVINGKKIPFRVMLKNDELMLMAGIWDVWMKGDYAVKSFTIVTTPANQEMKQIATRMPLVLNRGEDQRKWLSEMDLNEILHMLKTPAHNILKLYRISEKVNSVKNNSIELHQAVNDPITLFN